MAAPARWRVSTVPVVGSTNDDLAEAARSGAAGGTVLIAELQQAGKGRRGRTWLAPAGAGLTMSVLLELPEVPLLWRSWAGAVAGLCLVSAVRATTGLDATLKWPNDLLVDGRKCAGLLAESVTGGVVVGMGVNVSLSTDELPRPDATSLLLSGAAGLDRSVLAAAVLDELGRWTDRWRAAGGDPDRCGLRVAYRAACSTLGTEVLVHLPDGAQVHGRAVDVTIDGALVVDTVAGRRTFTAGDVQHLRPAPPPTVEA